MLDLSLFPCANKLFLKCKFDSKLVSSLCCVLFLFSPPCLRVSVCFCLPVSVLLSVSDYVRLCLALCFNHVYVDCSACLSSLACLYPSVCLRTRLLFWFLFAFNRQCLYLSVSSIFFLLCLSVIVSVLMSILVEYI